jgi:hypothetical protein
MAVANPFPGMNPYLEQRWQDFHAGYVAALRAELNESLPDDLVARTEIDLYVTTDRYTRPIGPDAYVVEPDRGQAAEVPAFAGGAATAVAPNPVRVRLRTPTTRIRRIEVREAAGDGRVVTAIVVFSPTNKSDRRGRQQYEKKRAEYLAAGISLVEIDLLRGGPHLLCVPPEAFPASVRKSYKVCVVRRPAEARADDLIEYELYGARLCEPLPPIAVPLRPDDADVALDLQAALAAAWRQGKCIDLRYDRELDPPLTDVERRIVRDRLGSPG